MVETFASLGLAPGFQELFDCRLAATRRDIESRLEQNLERRVQECVHMLHGPFLRNQASMQKEIAACHADAEERRQHAAKQEKQAKNFEQVLRTELFRCISGTEARLQQALVQQECLLRESFEHDSANATKVLTVELAEMDGVMQLYGATASANRDQMSKCVEDMKRSFTADLHEVEQIHLTEAREAVNRKRDYDEHRHCRDRYNAVEERLERQTTEIRECYSGENMRNKHLCGTNPGRGRASAALISAPRIHMNAVISNGIQTSFDGVDALSHAKGPHDPLDSPGMEDHLEVLEKRVHDIEEGINESMKEKEEFRHTCHELQKDFKRIERERNTYNEQMCHELEGRFTNMCSRVADAQASSEQHLREHVFNQEQWAERQRLMATRVESCLAQLRHDHDKLASNVNAETDWLREQHAVTIRADVQTQASELAILGQRIDCVANSFGEQLEECRASVQQGAVGEHFDERFAAVDEQLLFLRSEVSPDTVFNFMEHHIHQCAEEVAASQLSRFWRRHGSDLEWKCECLARCLHSLHLKAGLPPPVELLGLLQTPAAQGPVGRQ